MGEGVGKKFRSLFDELTTLHELSRHMLDQASMLECATLSADHVRFRGKTGRHLLVLSFLSLTQGRHVPLE